MRFDGSSLHIAYVRPEMGTLYQASRLYRFSCQYPMNSNVASAQATSARYFPVPGHIFRIFTSFFFLFVTASLIFKCNLPLT